MKIRINPILDTAAFASINAFYTIPETSAACADPVHQNFPELLDFLREQGAADWWVSGPAYFRFSVNLLTNQT